MENKNFKSKLTFKNINTTMGIAAFVLVFLFTFLYSSDLKEHKVILLSVFGGALLLLIIVWIVLLLYVRSRNYKQDANKQKIDQAIEAFKEQTKKEREKEVDA